MSRVEAILSRRQVEIMIADGKAIIIVDGYVLRVDSWLKYHPGGDKAIMHMVGRDATDEINAYVKVYTCRPCLALIQNLTIYQQPTLSRNLSAYDELQDWED